MKYILNKKRILLLNLLLFTSYNNFIISGKDLFLNNNQNKNFIIEEENNNLDKKKGNTRIRFYKILSAKKKDLNLNTIENIDIVNINNNHDNTIITISDLLQIIVEGIARKFMTLYVKAQKTKKILHQEGLIILQEKNINYTKKKRQLISITKNPYDKQIEPTAFNQFNYKQNKKYNAILKQQNLRSNFKFSTLEELIQVLNIIKKLRSNYKKIIDHKQSLNKINESIELTLDLLDEKNKIIEKFFQEYNTILKKLILLLDLEEKKKKNNAVILHDGNSYRKNSGIYKINKLSKSFISKCLIIQKFFKEQKKNNKFIFTKRSEKIIFLHCMKKKIKKTLGKRKKKKIFLQDIEFNNEFNTFINHKQFTNSPLINNSNNEFNTFINNKQLMNSPLINNSNNEFNTFINNKQLTNSPLINNSNNEFYDFINHKQFTNSPLINNSNNEFHDFINHKQFTNSPLINNFNNEFNTFINNFPPIQNTVNNNSNNGFYNFINNIQIKQNIIFNNFYKYPNNFTSNNQFINNSSINNSNNWSHNLINNISASQNIISNNFNNQIRNNNIIVENSKIKIFFPLKKE